MKIEWIFEIWFNMIQIGFQSECKLYLDLNRVNKIFKTGIYWINWITG